MPIFDRIKFDGVSNDEPWLVYKDKRENIVLGSQLVVGMGQEAIFIRGGRAGDIFTAGTHTLHTGNLPLLGTIVGRAFGGSTPFAAEVVFVNKTNNIVLNWGTTNPMYRQDPKYGLTLGLRAHGKFAVKVDDTRNFVSQLIGTVQLGSGFNHSIIWQRFSSLIIMTFQSQLMQFITQNDLSFLDISAYYKEISQRTFNELKNDFELCGLELVNFFIESVNAPQNEWEPLRKIQEEELRGPDYHFKDRTLKIVENNHNPEVAKIIAERVWGSSNRSTVSPTPPNNTMINCPHCHENIVASSRFCPSCGRHLPQQKFCSDCGQMLAQGARFCSNCGARCQ